MGERVFRFKARQTLKLGAFLVHLEDRSALCRSSQGAWPPFFFFFDLVSSVEARAHSAPSPVFFSIIRAINFSLAQLPIVPTHIRRI